MNDIKAAEFLGMSVHTIRDRRKKDTGPKVTKIGRSVRYTEADLTAWVDAQNPDFNTSMSALEKEADKAGGKS